MADMNASTPKTEPPPSTQLRKAVSGGSLSFILTATALSLARTPFAFGAAISPAQLSRPQGTLTPDQRGISIAPRHAACPTIVAQGGPLWTLVLQIPSKPSAEGTQRKLSAAGQRPLQEADADCSRLVYEKLTDGEQTWQIRLTLEIRKSGDGFQINGELRNDAEGWIVRDLKCPNQANAERPQCSLDSHSFHRSGNTDF